MRKIALILMLISIASQITGFFRELALSYFYGASNISDAYLISLTIPMVIFAFIGKSLSTSFIPIYASIENDIGEKKAVKFTRNLISHLLLIMTLIVVISYVFTPQIIKLFASGFDNPTTEIAIEFSRITIFGIYSMMMVNILTALLQYKNYYLVPALTGIVMNTVVIFSIYLSWFYQELMILSIGTLISMIAQLFLLTPLMKKISFKLNLYYEKNDQNLKEMIYLSIPVIIGVSVNEINVLVDRTIASSVAVGGISALNYANKLNGFIYGIFVFSIATVLYPTIIKKINQGDQEGFLKSFREATIGVLLFVLPATVGLMVLSEPIIKLLYGRGAFDQEALTLTSSALFFYSFGIVGVSLRLIISRIYYALKDTKTPMLNATYGMIINIVLNIILSEYLGIGGLALATSIAAIITTTLLFISLRKKIGPLGMKSIFISFMKILLASSFMGMFAKQSYIYFNSFLSGNTSLLISIVIATLFYGVLILLLKIKDVEILLNAIKEKMK
ncbi:murein biosynthesis integral membrane protein MurJ [Exiguobacterium chiriqhucha]|uniref:Probable lipid II flippase MurJ n=1 Tax=Exiguobacterium chiriqhucha RW-2 TaxID=1345023 RepID=U1N5C3_9BACL|nr:murein biosynthesis integral membrane protein MurJ [Exiguobacterium chiriqhucha]ERG67720.1 hypothetical protein M467_10555 [Exiguobacterium chiriqhucha RW-2]